MTSNDNDKNINALINFSEDDILKACQLDAGPLDSAFLCRSVSVLNPPDPIIIEETVNIVDACRKLKSNSVGCILVVATDGKLKGVFSERDYMSKVFESNLDITQTGISAVMTHEPFVARPDSPIAYCLSLMSEGGFRHLPLVDQDHCPIGIVSVRDVINYLVKNTVEGLLSV